MFLVVVLVFFICNALPLVNNIMEAVGVQLSDLPDELLAVTNLFVTINSSININAQRATSSRSCFNIYKRTSNRMMAKTHENGPKDLNKGQLLGFVSNSHFSDETLPMHVTS